MHKPLDIKSLQDMYGTVRIAIVWTLPQLLEEHGVQLAQVLAAAGLAASLFDHPDHRLTYRQLERLLAECERTTGRDDLGLAIGRHTRLEDFGLAGQAALCAATTGEGLRRFIEDFNLHSTATTIALAVEGARAHMAYAIVEPGLRDTRHLQLGSAVVTYNVLCDLFGAGWQPTRVTLASRPVAKSRMAQAYLHATLHFDAPETAVHFDAHWLDRPLPQPEPAWARRVGAELRLARAAMLEDFPSVVRRMLRKQLLLGPCAMENVAATLGMHRRTLDRHLRKHGLTYGDLFEAVRLEVAMQLLRETDLRVQGIGESLKYSSAANFATAFRRWTGMTPTEFRQQQR